MHVAQFVQRYPPALGGSEAYTARLCEHLAERGDTVNVWTSSAVELSEMWGRPTPPSPLPEGRGELARDNSGIENVLLGRGSSVSPFPSARGDGGVGRLHILPSPPLHFSGRRYILKALSLIPLRQWQCFTTPCNPICPAMWRAAARYDGPLDAVHATAFPYSFPIACGLKLARRRGVPLLLTPFLHLGDPTDPHDRTREQYTKPHLRWLLTQADRVFVQTRAERAAAVSLGVAERKVVLQGLGVDARECTGGRRELARTNWGVANEMVVGHLTNNSAEKGTVDLLRAAEIAWARGQQLRVVLAGPEMPNFRAFWNTFGPKDRVTRLGTLTDEQKRDFFAGIDCFALPSRCDSFGLVLLEAWANGKPNLVYRAGGPAELVRHNVDGLQAACGNVSELAEHLGRLATDANLRRALGENGQSRIGTEFRWGDKLELVRETIREVVAR
ncbi:Glycosyltransferase OS=Singulisphaera acidiphila (strain ATCC BAA-1392 / DSM 18658 / VKM B-2454 / MOB10) GN=Sinac_5387 PE=4 SV=1: Glyco_trans_4_4: Glycos_transf_1 [Gemmata massiliana]|uniref:Glycosyl transferase family 1 domain-containing protein n=1 Tax=Gemmata massiliana TaxID=1210884 RepID=A0A6P2D7S3_9BACT|nr:glycosyltransferase family 4 protein [Gemmata massiliana]VTR95552.1 Glycosyltransferase OS=Singulisphaera acidiphila (strain ATCC BAA-1392 / DSM 18658 / VKM B-2454 / MOB10) GN=Sinac_5387 PE=4 SV=1: Glyco_trans_4_4: Glycos_transf_1 [Gemmata massiliana]